MELPGSSWTLVSFETDMEVTPALTEAPATLTFSVEGEQAGRRTQRLQPLLRELHPDRRPPPYWSAWIHTHDVQPPSDGTGGPLLSGARSRRALRTEQRRTAHYLYRNCLRCVLTTPQPAGSERL